MPTITRLVAGKRNQSRVNIYFDGEFTLALSLDEVVKHGLKKGLELSEAEITKLKDQDATDYAYNKLLNFLSYRPRTVKEVRDRLYKYEVRDPGKQNLLIERLQSKGYLDDVAFARWFIDSRNTHRPRSPRRIEQELQAKGVSREVIKEVIGTVADVEQTIRALLEKKLGTSRIISLAERQKIGGYLTRQGFPWDKIKQVVKSWESE
jgi:regulatory protein